MEERDRPFVLIVDDNDRNRKLAADVLRLEGFQILEASGGREAIKVAVANLPDVVLMDLHLPDLDGAEAVRALRADPRTAAIPTIALTAASMPDAEWLTSVGFSGYIRKPIDIDTFPGLVRNSLLSPD